VTLTLLDTVTPKVFYLMDPLMTAEGTVGAPTCSFRRHSFFVALTESGQPSYVTPLSKCFLFGTNELGRNLFLPNFLIVTRGRDGNWNR
jgi:hypothetical protein